MDGVKSILWQSFFADYISDYYCANYATTALIVFYKMVIYL